MSIFKESPPIFYSFRRCPYAMRARLSLVISKTRVEIREVYLKEKPKEFLASSVSATVPCMVYKEKIIDESLDIMLWVLKKNDPQNWLKMPKIGFDLIKENDGPFKHYLDQTKYYSRYPEINPEESRKKAGTADLQTEEPQTNSEEIERKERDLKQKLFSLQEPQYKELSKQSPRIRDPSPRSKTNNKTKNSIKKT